MTEGSCGNNATPGSNCSDTNPSSCSGVSIPGSNSVISTPGSSSGISIPGSCSGNSTPGSCSDNSSPGSYSDEENNNVSGVEIDDPENLIASLKANNFANNNNTSEDEDGCEEESRRTCSDDLGACGIETNQAEFDFMFDLVKHFKKVDKSLAGKNMVVMQEVELSIPDAQEESGMTDYSTGALDITVKSKPSPCCQEYVAEDSYTCSDLVTCGSSCQNNSSISFSLGNFLTAPSECTDQIVEYPSKLCIMTKVECSFDDVNSHEMITSWMTEMNKSWKG